MARFEGNGLSRLIMTLEEMMVTPDELIEDMLIAQAEVIENAQKEAGKAYGVYRTGETLASIRHGRVQCTRYGERVITVYPGARNSDGRPNAEVAFINEFGKRGQPARPFMRYANLKAADKVAEVGAKIYDNWLKSRDL